MSNKVYTFYDVIHAEHTLEPLKCIHCEHVGEVIIDSYQADGYCQWCGEWQRSIIIECPECGETNNYFDGSNNNYAICNGCNYHWRIK